MPHDGAPALRLRGPEEKRAAARLYNRYKSQPPLTVLSPRTSSVFAKDRGILRLINLECVNKARTVNSPSSLETQY